MTAIGRLLTIQRSSITKLNSSTILVAENTLSTFYEFVFILVVTSGQKVLGFGGQQAFQFQLPHTFSRLTSGRSGYLLFLHAIYGHKLLQLGKFFIQPPIVLRALVNYSHPQFLSSVLRIPLSKQARPRRPPLISLVQSDVSYTRLIVLLLYNRLF